MSPTRCSKAVRAHCRPNSSAITVRGAAGPCAKCHVTAIDTHVLASHKGGEVTRQKHHHVGDLQASSNPSEWVRFSKSRKGCVHSVRLEPGSRSHHLGVDRPSAYREHSDV